MQKAAYLLRLLQFTKERTAYRLFLFFWILFNTLSASSQDQSQASYLTTIRVDLQVKDVSIKEALSQIQQQHPIHFVYGPDVDKYDGHKITLSLSNITVGEAVQQVLKNTNLRFTPRNDIIMIDEKPFQHPSDKAQKTVILEGVVTDGSGPIPGVSVLVVGTTTGTVTDHEGKYSIKAPIKEGRLSFSFVGYKNVEHPFDEHNTVVDVKMEENFTALSEVEITSIRKSTQPVAHTSDRELLQEIKMSTSIVSGISSEQIVKQADINAAQIVKRISGVTVTDESFLVVRGMNQRYNITYLGDNIAPSTEQYSRAFAMHLIPSRAIDKILVYKSPRADLFGDFAGAAVKVHTKDALAVKHLEISARIGYLPASTFGTINSYSGGSTDWLGFDDGSRNLPAAVPGFGDFRQAQLTPSQYVEAFDPTLTYGTRRALPDMQLNINYYDAFKVGGKFLHNVTSFSYTNETRFNEDIFRQQGNTLTMPNFNLNNSITRESRANEIAQLNLMQNFSFKFNDGNSVYLKNFLLQEGRRSTQIRDSRPNNGTDQVILSRTNILGYTSRFLYAGNFGGDHVMGTRHQLKWNLGYTNTLFSMPDQRIINLASATPENGNAEQASLSWSAAVRTEDENSRRQGIISRLFMDSREELYNASADYTWNWTKGIDLKAGTYHYLKERHVYRRIYTVHDALFTSLHDYANITELPGTGGYINPELIWFREQDLGRVWSRDYFRDDRTGLAVYDLTEPTDAYLATEQYNAGYFSMMAMPWSGKLEINAGVRLEHNRQKIAAAEAVGGYNLPLHIDRPSTFWLPSANVSFRPRMDWIFRAGYGRTVNRPEFREISPFRDFDYLNNEFVWGNTRLATAEIDNVDLRVEWYPKHNRGEAFSIGGFYKRLQHPIERIIFANFVGSGTFPEITYQNAEEAHIRGLEAEVRKSLSFIPGNLFDRLSFVANGTWIFSEAIKDEALAGDQARFTSTFKRPLQGQAPYVMNAGLFYDNPEIGTKASVSWNVSGASIYAVGTFTENALNPETGSTRGSVLQLPQHLMDVAITRQFANRWQAKFSLQNLLNSKITWVQDNDFNNRYNPERLITTRAENGESSTVYKGDNIFQQYNPGRYFLVTLTYSF